MLRGPSVHGRSQHDSSEGSEWSWFARVVELPGCTTEARGFEELGATIEDAEREWVEEALEHGDPVLEPKTRKGSPARRTQADDKELVPGAEQLPARAPVAPVYEAERGPEQERGEPELPPRGRVRVKKSRRYDSENYVQVSAVVSRRVKADFDVALAREKAVSRIPGQGRHQFDVLESLMRFYAEHGDPYEVFRDRDR